MRRVLALVVFVALLIRSAWFAWSNREIPQFGRPHYDAIYFVAAKSLADGYGYRYRIQSLLGARPARLRIRRCRCGCWPSRGRLIRNFRKT